LPEVWFSKRFSRGRPSKHNSAGCFLACVATRRGRSEPAREASSPSDRGVQAISDPCPSAAPRGRAAAVCRGTFWATPHRARSPDLVAASGTPLTSFWAGSITVTDPAVGVTPAAPPPAEYWDTGSSRAPVGQSALRRPGYATVERRPHVARLAGAADSKVLRKRMRGRVPCRQW
jgi:hypothetical protein